MSRQYVVFESFDFKDYGKTIWHLSRGDVISYEFYTDTFDLHYSEPTAIEENNAIRIYVYAECGNSTYFSGPAIDIKKYVSEIPQMKCTNEISQVKSTNYYPKKEEPKHLKVLQFDNLDKMNDELSKYDEKDIVSIVPIMINEHYIAHEHYTAQTIIYCVTVRE